MFNKMNTFRKEQRIKEIQNDLEILEYLAKGYGVDDLEFESEKYPWSANKMKKLKDELFVLTH